MSIYFLNPFSYLYSGVSYFIIGVNTSSIGCGVFISLGLNTLFYIYDSYLHFLSSSYLVIELSFLFFLLFEFPLSFSIELLTFCL